MTNVVYPKLKEEMLKALLDGVTIKAVLVDLNDYTYDPTHEFLSDLSAGVVGTAVTITNPTFTNGRLDSDNFTFPSVTGDESEAVALYIDTGNAATSRLIYFGDVGSGLPVTPNGGGIDMTVPATGWFNL